MEASAIGVDNCELAAVRFDGVAPAADCTRGQFAAMLYRQVSSLA